MDFPNLYFIFREFKHFQEFIFFSDSIIKWVEV
jgi:hypothetical protein